MGKTLVADDDEDMRDLVQAVLVSAGHDVVAVANGIAALDRLRDEVFDLAVLDVQMPGMSGLAVLEATQRMVPARPPVIMLSGLTTFQDRNRGLAAGALAYVAKPFRIQEFLGIVDDVLRADGRSDPSAATSGAR